MKISILGGGWLGFPLGLRLIKKGFPINLSSSSSEKVEKWNSEGISGFLLAVSSEGIQGDISGFLQETEVLIIAIPPGLRRNPQADFVGSMRNLIKTIEVSEVKKVVFISSISVYRNTEKFPEYTEEDLPKGNSNSGSQLISSENLFRNNKNFKTSILRFGGLIGPQRNPINFIAGRSKVKDPNGPVNLIHLEDCIGIIMQILEKNSFGETFNAVYPDHPSKEKYYLQKAQESNLSPPQFDTRENSNGKIISVSKAENLLSYHFKRPI